MSLRKDLSDEEFEALSITKKKQYVAQLLIKTSKAQPVAPPLPPIAIVMAGVPGAGKTEFLDTLSELLKSSDLGEFIRIDLDEIVTVYPGYTPKTDAQFRAQGNAAVAKCVDVAKEGRFNMMIDGTFAGKSGVSIRNVQRLVDAGYIVRMYFMHDEVETSWAFTQGREKLTSRGIDRAGFERATKNVINNLKEARAIFGANSLFRLNVVLQKKLRDKDYTVIVDPEIIDKILDEGYNIDNKAKS